MLQIAPDKVAEVISLAREIETAPYLFDTYVTDLNVEEQATLVALMWIGRGTYQHAELAEAIETAMTEATVPTEVYLKGSPHLADHLESALDALGVDVREVEDAV